MLNYGIVPDDFGNTYTVPIPKSKLNFGKALCIDDFRGISISPVNSKVFEHLFLTALTLFLNHLTTSLGLRRD